MGAWQGWPGLGWAELGWLVWSGRVQGDAKRRGVTQVERGGSGGAGREDKEGEEADAA